MSASLLVPRRQVVLGAALGGLAAAAPAFSQAKAGDPASVDALKAVLDSYEKAFSAHDVAAVLKHFAPNAIVVGTGPGEIWGGPEEITAAYKNFFQAFDPGKQKFEPVFRDGHVLGDMAWIVAMSKVSFTKGTATTEFGLNTSAVFEKVGGTWLVRALHFSNLTPGQPAAK
jgi:uncharacterized protein (TIGR02246 family)